jgi:hypothetical protein
MLSMRDAHETSTLSQRVHGDDAIAPDDEPIESCEDRTAGKHTGTAPRGRGRKAREAGPQPRWRPA